MLPNRWSTSLIVIALLAALVTAGVSMRQTALAGPRLQQETATATATALPSETATPIDTVTATPIDTVTATPIDTVTATPIDTVTATPTVTVTATPTATVTATPTATPGPGAIRPFMSYAATFVCGDAAGGPANLAATTVISGSYATEISVHNPHYLGGLTVHTKVLLLIDQGQPVGRAPTTAQAGSFGPAITLDDDAGMLDDCASIWAIAHPGTPVPAPMPLMSGYLVIVSPLSLDVTSLVTAAPEQGGSALAAITVEGKTVLIPASAFPGGVLPSEAQFTHAQAR